FRHAANGYIWELPAGKIDNREPPLQTAQRELREEAGRTAAEWRDLGRYLSSPGVFTEVIHLFMATNLKATELAAEAHEVIEVHWKPFVEALDMAQSGEIEDGKTPDGLLRAAHARKSYSWPKLERPEALFIDNHEPHITTRASVEPFYGRDMCCRFRCIRHSFLACHWA